MHEVDKKFNVGVSALAWHLYHWFAPDSEMSLEDCLSFAEFMYNNYSPRQVNEDDRQKLAQAFVRSKQRLDHTFKLHKCTECGAIFTKSECSDCA